MVRTAMDSRTGIAELPDELENQHELLMGLLDAPAPSLPTRPLCSIPLGQRILVARMADENRVYHAMKSPTSFAIRTGSRVMSSSIR